MIQMATNRNSNSFDEMSEWLGSDGEGALSRILDEYRNKIWVVEDSAVKRNIAWAVKERLRRANENDLFGRHQLMLMHRGSRVSGKVIFLRLVARAFWIVFACACFIAAYIRSPVRTTMLILRFPFRWRHTTHMDLEMGPFAARNMPLYRELPDEQPFGIAHTMFAHA
jgi:hypothetical protein